MSIVYAEYICSPEWKSKAEAAKDRASRRCQVCNRHEKTIQLESHHRTYERLGAELPADITVLCEKCHRLYEHHKRLMTPPKPEWFAIRDNDSAQWAMLIEAEQAARQRYYADKPAAVAVGKAVIVPEQKSVTQ